MRRLLPAILLCIILVACSDVGGIDVNRASKRKTSASRLYTKAETVLLEDSAFDGPRAGEPVLLEVAGGRFFILSRNRDAIGVFDSRGEHVASLDGLGEIIDFSAWQDKYLEVLTARRIVEYDVADLSVANTFDLPETELELKSLARLHPNEFLLSAITGEKAYSCSYYIDIENLAVKDHFIYLETIFHNADDYQTTRYFQDSGKTFYFTRNPGTIVCCTLDDFHFPIFEFDWGKDSSLISLTNVQKKGDNLYMRFRTGDDEGTVVYNTFNHKYKVIKLTREGKSFPIGVIHDGINYYCTDASELPGYLDCDPPGDGPVIIKYCLQ